MSFIDTIPPEVAGGEVREMYERQRASWGYLPNYARTFSLRPGVLARWAQLLSEIRRPMSDRCFELVTTVAAYDYRHSACALAHGKKLADIVGEDAVLGIVAKGDDPALTDAEREIVRFARKVAADASAVTADDVRRLKAHGVDDGEIFDIAAAVAGRAFFTKLLDALGSEPDHAFMNLSGAMRDALTVGRPIAAKAGRHTDPA